MAGWTSSLLGGRTPSNWKQYDALRTDLTRGKFWSTSGTNSVWVRATGGHGYIGATKGFLHLHAATNTNIIFTHAVAASQTWFYMYDSSAVQKTCRLSGNNWVIA